MVFIERENIKIARTYRFELIFNECLDLLTVRALSTGRVPEFELSISKQDAQEYPEILTIFNEVTKNWSD